MPEDSQVEVTLRFASDDDRRRFMVAAQDGLNVDLEPLDGEFDEARLFAVRLEE